MNCNEAREYLLDLAQASDLRQASAAGRVPHEVSEHLNSCRTCAEELESLRATMSLMDEWQAPEVSPYFDSRLRARVREAAAQTRAGWLDWLRKPAIAAALAILMVMGAIVFRSAPRRPAQPAGQIARAQQVPPDTAVTDLRDLDQNLDMYANFDVLDDISGQQEQTP